MSHRAVFLDRDGVINKKAPPHEYILRWEEFVFLPYVAETIRYLNQKGFLVIVHSNQRGIARGLMDVDTLREIHERMIVELKSHGAYIDGVYYCPHDYSNKCNCRKPKPGMLLSVAKNLDIDLKHSFLVGDSRDDIEAGKVAGCKTVLVLTGEVQDPKQIEDWKVKPDHIISNLLELREIVQ